MFNSFGEFFWTFMALSGLMFWACAALLSVLVINRIRTKRRPFYEQ